MSIFKRVVLFIKIALGFCSQDHLFILRQGWRWAAYFYPNVSVERSPSSFDLLYQNDRLLSNGTVKKTCACSPEDSFGSSEGFLYARYQTWIDIIMIHL